MHAGTEGLLGEITEPRLLLSYLLSTTVIYTASMFNCESYN